MCIKLKVCDTILLQHLTKSAISFVQYLAPPQFNCKWSHTFLPFQELVLHTLEGNLCDMFHRHNFQQWTLKLHQSGLKKDWQHKHLQVYVQVSYENIICSKKICTYSSAQDIQALAIVVFPWVQHQYIHL